MNNVRLVCGGVSVDLPSDFGILINKSIADIREPESRSSDWSKTFTLPGTKANNKLFTHLFDLNLSIRNTSATNFNPDFNPNLKADALLQVDEVTQIQGFIRLLGIKVNDINQIEYECSMHGQLADLFAKVADAKLSDLDFTAYNHIISDTNIFNSWDTSIVKNGSSGYVNFSGGAPIGEGYVYGWIDNGQYANYKTLYTDDMTPYLYAKTVVDSIFSGTGYSYSSGSFFNSALFKRLVVPCPTKSPILTEQNILDRQFQAKFSGSVVYGNNNSGTRLLFPTEILDPSGQWNTSTSEFTNDFFSQTYDFTVYLDGSANGLRAIAGAQDTLWFRLFINGRVVQEKAIWTTNDGSGNATINDYLRFQNIKLQKNDDVAVHWYAAREGGIGTFLTGAQLTLTANTSFYNFVVESSYGYNDTMDFAGFFGGVETKQREFMRWIFTMFNLYVEPSEIDKQLVILPREDFYTTSVRDWTRKRDLSQPLDIIPMGELDAGKYLFTYKDGEDEGNKFYKEGYSRTYGDRQILVQNDFVKDEKKIEIGFVPTIIVRPEQEIDKYLPEVATNDGKQKSGDLRILQYKVKTCAGYTVRNGSFTSTASGGTTKTKYPFMGHLDDPLTSTTDINFGMPRFIGLPPGTPVTNNNLFNQYWSKYLHEITDKDSKIVRGAFYLTPADMERLSFRDLYFFDGNYFRLNKVEDYDPINPSVNICEFLFLKSGLTFTATTGSVGGKGDQGQGQDTEFDPEGGGTSSKVINQRGFNIGQFNQAGDGVIVGDAVSNYGRANAAFATSGTTFLPDTQRSIVIGEGVTNVASDQVWLQGHLITQNNFSTNRIVYPTDNYTAGLYDDILICNQTTNATISLPAAAMAANKAYYIYKNTGAHQLDIDPFEGQLIDGNTTYRLTAHYECIQIVCDGTQWYVISKK